MSTYDVIIIGAGAAGLMAASVLAKKGKTVLILEARSRIGGRIYTHQPDGFSFPLEAGAEFVHGRLPRTLNLLQQAGISYKEATGKVWKINNGTKKETNSFLEGWDILEEKLKAVKNDCTFVDFLNQHFAEEKYREFRKSVLQFVQGYDAADAEQASTLGLREEWMNEDLDSDFRLEGGYGRLMHFLQEEFTAAGGTLQLSSPVSELHWQQKKVQAYTNTGTIYSAHQALITIPLGVWQQDETNDGGIQFFPDLPEKRSAARQMGFGSVIKVHAQFTEEFWKQEFLQKFPEPSFLLSDAAVPTWWTQLPNHEPVLTGWLAGPRARELKEALELDIRTSAIQSLAKVLATDTASVQDACTAFCVHNWTADKWARGAYSYATLHTKKAQPVLAQPVASTLYFAGEALYEGIEGGTVEAALVTGETAAQHILADR